MTFFHVGYCQLAQNRQHVLFEHPAHLCTAVLTVYQIHPCPVLEQLGNVFASSVAGLLRFSSSFLGSQTRELCITGSNASGFFDCQVFTQVGNAAQIQVG
ncbi:hypothetical protein D3C78_1123100 [compost metagenome]